MVNLAKERRKLKRRLQYIQREAISGGLELNLLNQFNYICNYKKDFSSSKRHQWLVISAILGFVLLALVGIAVENILSARCLLPSNYLVWEATRPVADCNYCVNITKPTILRNITRKSFNVSVYYRNCTI